MPLASLYTCSRCRREFNFNSIRYDEGRRLICVECLQKANKPGKRDAAGKPNENPPVNFICIGCRFKFSVRKESPKALKCPYCGKTKLMLVRKYKDENDLINESMNPRFDY